VRRIALFVEGRTELHFVQRLLEELAGKKNVVVETRKIVGGASVPRRTLILEAASVVGDEKYYVLIFDCGGDHQVKTRIMEEHQGLTQAGYSKILGIRDVRPDFTLAEIPRLAMGLRSHIRTSLAPVDFILCAMEIEAWFLAESSHYQRIDPRISSEAIYLSLGFHPGNDDLALRPTPASDLNACYRLGGKNYEKGAIDTVNALDFGEVFLTLPPRIPYLQKLVEHLEEFLTLHPAA